MNYSNRIEFGEVRVGLIARKNLLDCCDRNWVSSGEKVKQFEKEWGDLFNYKHNKAVSSGTDAVISMCLSLYDFGAKEGDGVIVPALSFIATANAVRAAGFTPVFVDIKRETLNINENLVEPMIESFNTVNNNLYGVKIRAIIAVHTMGRPCEMKKLKEIADKYEIKLFEDACEAHGAIYKGKYVGHYGDAAAFSFYVAHLICCGEGGMVSTKDKNIADIINSTRSHGRRDGELYFDFPRRGYNSKMNDLEASLGLEGIENFWDTFNVRYDNMKYIMYNLEYLRNQIWFSEEDEGNKNCPHGISFTVKDPNKAEGLQKALDDANIHWKRNFGCTPTQHDSFKPERDRGYYKLGWFPEAEYVGNYGIHIGCHQYLTQENKERIVSTVYNYFK